MRTKKVIIIIFKKFNTFNDEIMKKGKYELLYSFKYNYELYPKFSLIRLKSISYNILTYIFIF